MQIFWVFMNYDQETVFGVLTEWSHSNPAGKQYQWITEQNIYDNCCCFPFLLLYEPIHWSFCFVEFKSRMIASNLSTHAPQCPRCHHFLHRFYQQIVLLRYYRQQSVNSLSESKWTTRRNETGRSSLSTKAKSVGSAAEISTNFARTFHAEHMATPYLKGRREIHK